MSDRMTTPGISPSESELRQWLGPVPYEFWEKCELHISGSSLFHVGNQASLGTVLNSSLPAMR